MLVAPGHNRVVPLQPEFIVPQDGHDKQDCETVAARRWLAAHGPEYARLPANRSVRRCGQMDGHFLFVCKPSSHPTLYLTGVELPALTNEAKHGCQKFTYSDQWLCDVLLRDGPDALAVNWLIIEIRNAGRQDYLSQPLHHRFAGQP